MNATSTPKAIALLSGGLDSLLAAKIVQEEGVEVIGLHLVSPFGCHEEVERRANAIGIRLLTREKGSAYLDIVKKPRFGYGRAVNPCIDCRVFMFEMAEQVREEEGADFIITGEVLGQRPMSQQREAFSLIDRKSPEADRVLRPLSAHALPESLAEREGWVRRENMCDIRGRQRIMQLDLAERFGITDYGAPGGGCLLTEMSFAPKVRDFFKHDHFTDEEQRLAQSEILRLGRHFRLHSGAKVVVARNSEENRLLEDRWPRVGGTFIHPDGFRGPVALLLGESGESERRTAGALVARYGKPEKDSRIAYRAWGETQEVIVPIPGPIPNEEIEEMRL